MERLTDKHIKDFLEQVPLYTWKEFRKPQINRGSLWIKEVDAFCENCQQIRPFQDLRSRGSGSGMEMTALSTGQSYFQFSCVSCRKQKREYLVDQIVTDEIIKFQKYGELPRKNIERDVQLQNFFSNDLDCYEKAAVCLTHGYGIAAFVYLRRIIENNIHSLLNLLMEDVQSSDGNKDVKEALLELKNESPTSNKIKVANKALPEYLKPNGLNPLGRLYQVLSEGVHNFSDEECLERTNAVKECLKYLICELSSRKKNRERFKGVVAGL